MRDPNVRRLLAKGVAFAKRRDRGQYGAPLQPAVLRPGRPAAARCQGRKKFNAYVSC